FFQAEDGIRDFHVTGVQTCALPIFGECHAEDLGGDQRTIGELVERRVVREIEATDGRQDHPGAQREARMKSEVDCGVLELELLEIGRASCRERVEMSWMDGAMKHAT